VTIALASRRCVIHSTMRPRPCQVSSHSWTSHLRDWELGPFGMRLDAELTQHLLPRRFTSRDLALRQGASSGMSPSHGLLSAATRGR
jgi:hypothetical protein